MKEYIIKYRVGTDWHEPHNTTTFNEYTEIIEAESAKEALSKTLPSFSNPNKSVEILSVKSI
jgi:hypothetical protein